MKFTPKPLTKTDDASRAKSTRSDWVKDVVGVVLFFTIAYFVLGWLGIAVAQWIPDRWEQKMAPAATLMTVNDDEVDLTRAQQIFDHLLDGEETRDLDYQLFVMNAPMPNAVAIPGGKVGVTPELLEIVTSDRGLAFVLAHELGHHEHRHPLRAMGRSLFLYTAAALVGDGSTLLSGALSISDSNFSRTQESAADDFALRLIHRKYGDTQGALELFKWMQENESEPAYQKYLGTHPLSKDRIATLERLAVELSNQE